MRPLFSVPRGIAVAVVGLGVWSLLTLRFQTELLPLFPQNLDSVRALAKAQEGLASARQVIAVPEDAVDRTTLSALAEALRGHPGIGAVRIGLGTADAVPRLAAGLVAELPADRFAAAARTLTPEQALPRLRETVQRMGGAVDEAEMMRLRFDPLRLQDFLPADPSATMAALPPLLTIESDRPLKTFADHQQFVAAVRSVLNAESAKLSPAPRFLLTGPPAFTAEISAQMRRDVLAMLGFAFGLTFLTFWIVYRSLVPLGWILLVQALAGLCGIIAARLVFGELNVLSLGFASILPGLGMDYSILVYHHFARKGDEAAWPALRRTIWFCAIATAATFGLLYFSSFPGLRQLAVLVGAGLIATAFFATTFLAGRLRRKPPEVPPWIDRTSEAMGGWIARHRVALRVAAGALLLVAIILSPRLMRYPFYDPGVERLQPTQLEAYRGQAILQRQLSAMPQPTPGGDAAANRRQWKPVDTTALAESFHAAGFGAEWAAPTLQAVDLLNRWHAEETDLSNPGDAWAQLRADLNRTAVDDFKRLSLINLLGVIVLCAVAHRSLRLVGLNLAGLALALILLAGLLWLNRASMTLVSLLCIPLLIGLTVSYSLYVLLGVERSGGELPPAFRRVAVPVGLTGLCSLIGFTAPTLTHQPVLQNFGLVMDLGTAAAVLSGLVLAPALYWRPAQRRSHHSGLYGVSCSDWCAAAARRLPLALTRALAHAAGTLYAWTHPEGVAVVHRNLLLLDPAMPPRTARRVYGAFAQTIADYFYIGTRDPAKAARIIAEKQGLEHLRQVAAEGKGGLLVTAHHGLFELGGLVMSQFGFRTVAVTIPEPRAGLTAWRAAFRRGWGVETIEIGNDSFAFLQIADRLRQGCFVAALIDRPNPHYNVPVAFPNGQAGFSAAILLLALQCGAPVIPTTMYRRADGRYQAEVFAPIRIENRGSREETLRFYTQQIADTLLPTLCRHPEQWYQFVPLSRSDS